MKHLTIHGRIASLILLFSASLFTGTVAQAASLPLKDLTAAIQKRYEETKDFSAGFIQKATLQSTGQTIEESGTVHLKKPKRIRWDYIDPKGKTLVINPETAWLYLPDDNMAYRYRSEQVFTSQITVRFLTGLWTLNEDFLIRFADEGTKDKTGAYHLMLSPKIPDGSIKTLRLTVDGTTFCITGATLTDLYENKTDLRFRNITTNNSLADALFVFTPPAGTDVYDANRQPQ